MQLEFPPIDNRIPKYRKNGIVNKLDAEDNRFHNCYRFVLSFPPHLVREYLSRFNLEVGDTILDPFCGTGTTIIEAKLHGVSAIGIEANPVAHFATLVSVDWQVDPDELLEHASLIAKKACEAISLANKTSLKTLPEEAFSLLLKDSISPLPLHKSLILLEQINMSVNGKFRQYELLALAKVLVFSISNLHFGPEVGVSRVKKEDALVVESWLDEMKSVVSDLRNTQNCDIPSTIFHADARELTHLIQPNSIDAVFTSPPYPNEKDYTRITRLESVILGFMTTKAELRALKKGLLRSNTRNIYKGDNDDAWITENSEIQAISSAIENRRIALGKTSGFEKLYGTVIKQYFGGMTRHLAELRTLLKPGAYLGYVVGDQASFFQIMIHTGELLAGIAQSLGYRVVSIDLFRTRLATATRQQLREEVVVLQWLGQS